MNNRKRRKLKEKLSAELVKAKRDNDFLAILKLSQELKQLDDAIVEADRVTYSALAKSTMSNEEINDFTADVVAMIVASDILIDYAMRVENRMRKFDKFESSEIIKIKHAIRLLQEIVKTIDDMSKGKVIRTDEGEITTLTEHYQEIVDEVEQHLYGWRNVITNIVRHKILKSKNG